jgi:threonine synthase
MSQRIRFTSTRGQTPPVEFDEAVLKGFAPDGGLFVPDHLPHFIPDELTDMAGLSYPDLAFTILSRFIAPDIIPGRDLKKLIRGSFEGFDHPDILPLVACPVDPSVLILELFHGPTLSFKDIAMGFLIRVMDYLLRKKGEHLNLVLATTGDTGPAAAHASVGRPAVDCWPLFPLGMITEEQERQMTCLDAPNVHPVGVENCPDGGDDLDRVVLNLFSDPDLKKELGLSSVNSINWCRVMVQSIHYFYGYFRACDRIGDPIAFSVPSGAFGNLFAGYLAREMGLPASGFICAVNANQTLFRAFSSGLFKKEDLIPTLSSAIDIVVPYNFWRFLYFAAGRDGQTIRDWMDRFHETHEIQLDAETLAAIRNGFKAVSISDVRTLETMRRCFSGPAPYLPDPHTAVSLAGALTLKPDFPAGTRIICLATAHPAKFPRITAQALEGELPPPSAVHPSLTRNAKTFRHLRICRLEDLETELIRVMRDKKGATHG